jgi:trk system potassium uptake protein TrkA
MYIIIIGGGKVGYYLGRALLDQGHEVLVVEKDAAKSESIRNELGSACVRGDGCEVSTLADIGTGRADMFIAVTGDDEDNLVACQVARQKFNVPRTLARTNNPRNEVIFKKMGIDVTVSATNIIMEYIEQEVPTHQLIHLLHIRDRGLEIVEVKIPPQAPTIGKMIKDISLPPGTMLSLLIRKQEKPQVPSPETMLQAEDQIIAVTTPETESGLRTALRGV